VNELLVQIVDVEERVPGIVVGMIAADPQERWVVGYGRLSSADERVPNGNTVYEIGSITKLFTGILLAQAVMNGEVKLDDPITIYLPEGVTAPEYEGQSITLLDLATHTSGLPRDIYDLSSLEQMYAALSKVRLPHEPGSSYGYSNFGMGLLGNFLVQRAGQEDYEAILLERIFHPPDMDSTRVQQFGADRNGTAARSPPGKCTSALNRWQRYHRPGLASGFKHRVSLAFRQHEWIPFLSGLGSRAQVRYRGAGECIG
jgi:CubicO group peptidase (beta-lactamase class C family)